MVADLIPGFEQRDVEANGMVIRAALGGSRPPLLLLHGHPQTHVSWHKVARKLAERFNVVSADLQGAGDSTAPSACLFTEYHRHEGLKQMNEIDGIGHNAAGMSRRLLLGGLLGATIIAGAPPEPQMPEVDFLHSTTELTIRCRLKRYLRTGRCFPVSGRPSCPRAA
jgi:hypothetical protein